MEYMDPIQIPMLVAATADETTSDPVPLNNCKQHYHGVEFHADVTSGVVVVETAPSRDYAGAWTEILSVDASVGLMGEISFPGPGGFVRHRISAVIAGGATPVASSWTRRLLTS
jgi:hypothetical protein